MPKTLWCMCGVTPGTPPRTRTTTSSTSFNTFLVIPGVAGSSPVSRPRLKSPRPRGFFNLERAGSRTGDSELVETARGRLRLPEPWAKGSTVRGTVHQAECRSKIGRPQSGLRPVPLPVAWVEVPSRPIPGDSGLAETAGGLSEPDAGRFESRWHGSKSPAGPHRPLHASPAAQAPCCRPQPAALCPCSHARGDCPVTSRKARDRAVELP